MRHGADGSVPVAGVPKIGSEFRPGATVNVDGPASNAGWVIEETLSKPAPKHGVKSVQTLASNPFARPTAPNESARPNGALAFYARADDGGGRRRTLVVVSFAAVFVLHAFIFRAQLRDQPALTSSPPAVAVASPAGSPAVGSHPSRPSSVAQVQVPGLLIPTGRWATTGEVYVDLASAGDDRERSLVIGPPWPSSMACISDGTTGAAGITGIDLALTDLLGDRSAAQPILTSVVENGTVGWASLALPAGKTALSEGTAWQSAQEGGGVWHSLTFLVGSELTVGIAWRCAGSDPPTSLSSAN